VKLTIGVAGSAAGNITGKLEKAALAIGQEIAKSRAILVTGACSGLPFEAARGAKTKKGLVVGVSPAENKNEHLKKYKMPTKFFDVIIYSGFGLKGRNVLWVRSCDAIICIAGRIGTLNEFTIAYDEGRLIGVLQPGGVSKLIPKIISIAKKGKIKVTYGTDPKKLVTKVVKILKSR